MDTKPRILIAEDEQIVALDLKATLKRLGYSVISTECTGEGVVEKAAIEYPDLILMDIILKGKLNGIEAALKIIANQNVPIIYLTASSDKETINEVKKSSPFGFIAKPFDEIQLSANIETALSKFRASAN